MSDGVYRPNNAGRTWRMEISDKVRLKDGGYFNPNVPGDRSRNRVQDKRPVVLLAQAGFDSAEEWGNAILAKRNGHG